MSVLHLPAAARFHADLGDVQVDFLFSFAHYYDPANPGFGALRVLNDQVVAPRTALPLHAHTEVEIVLIGLTGTLTYSDAAGNHRDLPAGSVLRLTAGTGLQHAEANRTATEARALELWFVPGKASLLPTQEQQAIWFATHPDTWVPLASGRGDGGSAALFLNCDATVWATALTAGRSLSYAPDDATGARQLLLYVLSGAVTVNGQPLAAAEQLRLSPAAALTVTAPEKAQLLLIDLAADDGL